MTLPEQIYAQAVLLSGGIADGQEHILQALCRSACANLSSRLRPGLGPEDCRADFLAAGALYALAALSEIDTEGQMEYVKAGDVTLRRRGGSAAANCLRNQAELMISPYLADRFSFRGV